MLVWILFIIFILVYCNLLHKFSNLLIENFKLPLDFFLASPILGKYSNFSYYNVSVYSILKNFTINQDFMIHLMPQDLYFFVHDGILVYHPRFEKIMENCDKHIYVGAYIFSNNNPPRMLCHRKLDYLKNIYKYKVFYKTFDSLQTPEAAINLVQRAIIKTRGLTKILRKLTNDGDFSR